MTGRSSAKTNLAGALISWWRKNKRDFPWRKTRRPYANLFAEILLRKTTARQVANAYQRLLSKYPNPSHLLRVPLNEIEDDIRPLGIYKVRAKLLKSLANVLVQKYHGDVPRSLNNLLELPGVDKYSANAVLCFAYGQRAALVDVNVARVLQRVFGIKAQKKQPSDDPVLWQLSSKLVQQQKNAREFNWALLDFAAKICSAQKPLCSECPISYLCKSTKAHK